MSKIEKSAIFYLFLIVFLFISDQTIKFFVAKNTLPDMGGFLVNFCNPNLAWGIPMNGFLFTIIWILIVFFIFYEIKKRFSFLLLAVLAGAFSNIIDRLTKGCVVDYLSFPYFPAFNIADSMITIGLLLFLVTNFLKNEKVD